MFDLYDSLQSQITPNQKVNLDTLAREISQLDIEGQTFVFALIYYHCKLHQLPLPPLSSTVPIDMKALPKPLLQILAKFTLMHQQHMLEQRSMEDAQQIAQSINK